MTQEGAAFDEAFHSLQSRVTQKALSAVKRITDAPGRLVAIFFLVFLVLRLGISNGGGYEFESYASHF